MITAKIHVTLKPSVLDPQGGAVARSLHSLGYDEVHDVRVGRLIEVTVDETDHAAAEARVRQMCEQLLTNPVIERYEFELAGAA